MIGNIIDNTAAQYPKFYNRCRTLDGVIDNLPTLVVGSKYAERVFPDNKLYLTDNQIMPYFFWAYSFFENKSLHEKQLSDFFQECKRSVCSNFNFKSIDLFTQNAMPYNEISHFIVEREKELLHYRIGFDIYSVSQRLCLWRKFDLKTILTGAQQITESNFWYKADNDKKNILCFQ